MAVSAAAPPAKAGRGPLGPPSRRHRRPPGPPAAAATLSAAPRWPRHAPGLARAKELRRPARHIFLSAPPRVAGSFIGTLRPILSSSTFSNVEVRRASRSRPALRSAPAGGRFTPPTRLSGAREVLRVHQQDPRTRDGRARGLRPYARTASAARRGAHDRRRPALLPAPPRGARPASGSVPTRVQRPPFFNGALSRTGRVGQPSGPHLSSRAVPRSPPPSATRRVPPRRAARRLRPVKCRLDTLPAAEIWLSATHAPILTRTFGPYVERGPQCAQRRELRPFRLAGADLGRRQS